MRSRFQTGVGRGPALVAGGDCQRSAGSHRRRRHVPESDLQQVVHRLRHEDRREDQLSVDRLGRRHSPALRADGGFRRERRADDRRRAGEGEGRPGAAHSRRCSAPSSSRTTSRASRKPLRLDGRRVADIFLGKITKWNDARIAALNPGVKLPGIDILVVHRSDGQRHDLHLHRLSREREPGVGGGPARARRCSGQSDSAARATKA